jgi:hypothetical protein
VAKFWPESWKDVGPQFGSGEARLFNTSICALEVDNRGTLTVLGRWFYLPPDTSRMCSGLMIK